MRRLRRALVCAILAGSSAAMNAQDEKQLVQQAVKTELAADAADHSRWLYFEIDRKPHQYVEQWVAQTRMGDLKRVLRENGQQLSEDAQRRRMENFAHDTAAEEKQRKSGQHDDRQATEMLSLLPQAFIWKKAGEQGGDTILEFTPDPNFRPPDYQSRVFAAMQGEMMVDNAQHRIVSLKGRLIRDVKFGYGLFGELSAGGTFDAERREIGKGIWQITETHVHIAGRALLFKSISEQEDDQKSKFTELPGDISFEDAEKRLLAQKQ
jgi:hypothetical protein